MTLLDTDDTGEGDTPVGGILRSANGNLDIIAAWRWNQFQILDWLKELVKNPQLYGIDSEYVDSPDTVEAGKHLKLNFVVEYINYLRMECIISDPLYHKFVFDPSKCIYTWVYPKATYAGYELPVRTLYDAIGWILSITAVPASNTANQNNFCLPLIGLFGKWCSVLLPVESLPAMLHVAYWYDKGGFRLLLGATPGADQMMYSQDQEVWHKLPLESWQGELPPRSTISASRWSANKKDDVYWGVRGWDIITSRQQIFEKNGMVIDESHNHKIDRAGMYEAKSGFGRCAETLIYLWMLQRKNQYDTVESVRGFALDPRSGIDKGWVTILPEYNAYQVSRGLREPCQPTCQRLMMPYFREGDEEKCLFKLEHMDELENGQKPSELRNKKGKKA